MTGLRGQFTKFFTTKIYPKKPRYFRRMLKLAEFNPYWNQKLSKDFKFIKGINTNVHFRVAEFIEELHFIQNLLSDDIPITYLEFGVFQGNSILTASKIFNHTKSRFIGFDTFEGLPEPFDPANHPTGQFSTHGKIPEIDDPRVFFIKGLFQNTLDEFMKNIDSLSMEKYSSELKNQQLVINLDADLYSSTLFCLTKLDSIISKDTIIRFDEFSSLEDEWVALRDYARSYYRDFEIIASSSDRWHTIIRIKK